MKSQQWHVPPTKKGRLPKLPMVDVGLGELELDELELVGEPFDLDFGRPPPPPPRLETPPFGRAEHRLMKPRSARDNKFDKCCGMMILGTDLGNSGGRMGED